MKTRKTRKTRKTDPATAAPIKAAVDGTQEATPQHVASMFREYQKRVTEICNRFAYRQDDRELAALYVTWRDFTGRWRNIALEHVANTPPLPEVPPLAGNDFYAGMLNLGDFCAEAANRLCAVDVKAPALPPDGNRAAENPHGFLGAADLAKVFHVPPEKMPTLHKRLERFRKRHANDSEYVAAVEEAGPREAHYLHAVKYVLPEIQDLTRPH
jgi:hypothetical protein